jgi:hypothetical protein
MYDAKSPPQALRGLDATSADGRGVHVPGEHPSRAILGSISSSPRYHFYAAPLPATLRYSRLRLMRAWPYGHRSWHRSRCWLDTPLDRRRSQHRPALRHYGCDVNVAAGAVGSPLDSARPRGTYSAL